MKYIHRNISIVFSLIIFTLIGYFHIYWKHNERLFQNEEFKRNGFLNKVLLKNDKNIFFLETSCALKEANFLPGGLHLTNRQACAIYSTAKMNPSRPVIVYHSCPLQPNYYESSSKAALEIIKLDNVYIINAKYEDILRGTLIENLITSNKLVGSIHLVEHTADVLRVLLLYRYGGAYMDLDFITIKSFDSLPKNMLAVEKNKVAPPDHVTIANGFMQFEHKGTGNKFLRNILIDLSKHFSQTTWSGNGGELLNKYFLKLCLAKDILLVKSTEMIFENLCEITLIKASTFYPINCSYYELLFDGYQTKSLINNINDSIAVHFWNKRTKNYKVKIGEDSMYEVLARHYCPPVLERAGERF